MQSRSKCSGDQRSQAKVFVILGGIDRVANGLREQILLQEIVRLQQKVAELTLAQTALEAQRQLLAGFVEIARSPINTEILKQFLLEALTLSTNITGAERGSLLLVDRHGKIEDAIFTHDLTQTPGTLFNQFIDRGVAGWINTHRQIVLIPDTEQDQRWLKWPDNQYKARSVLGVPILKEQTLYGVITLLHSVPHYFSPATVNVMDMTAGQMSLVLENAQIYGRLQRYSQSLNMDLEKGRQIQINFLPAIIPHVPGWEIAAHFQPADQMAGDFYDIFELPQGQVGLVIADVCDKGVGAALFMGLFRSLMRIFSGQTVLAGLSVQSLEEHQMLAEQYGGDAIAPPTDASHPMRLDAQHMLALRAIRLTNDYIAINHGDLGMFATLFFGVLNPKTGELTYVNAGHEPLMVLTAAGTVREELRASGPALGVMPKIPFRMRRTVLAAGEILLGYTDGVTDARATDERFFTKPELLKHLAPSITSAQTLLNNIMAAVRNHTGVAKQFDDVTLLAVRRLPREEDGWRV
ncbi:SpoIIE family protein phosphatase [Spirulina major CS-329]|uniref:PP2C family protein-serine/threonine phosphatase n=1 Tax=Spirulina TaxID=1154 RepID=UPI00232EAE64|nr:MULTISPECIES: GAF domain-containing SpoIIE family protein phosphatase [Spirulina]MDB9504867.1 SpoIIE family protein phosphatase [Spirulina major CS-329]